MNCGNTRAPTLRQRPGSETGNTRAPTLRQQGVPALCRQP